MQIIYKEIKIFIKKILYDSKLFRLVQQNFIVSQKISIQLFHLTMLLVIHAT